MATEAFMKLCHFCFLVKMVKCCSLCIGYGESSLNPATQSAYTVGVDITGRRENNWHWTVNDNMQVFVLDEDDAFGRYN